MKKIHVIGITGTAGAGKSDSAKFLKILYGAEHFSVRKFLEEEGAKNKISLEGRGGLHKIGNLLREKHSPGYIVRAFVERMIGNKKEGCFVIESLRCPGEIEYLLKKFGTNFTLIGVDAPVIIRHGRSRVRGTMTDDVDFDEFVRLESLETLGTNPWVQNLSVCMDMVAPQFRIRNQWTTRHLINRTREIAGEIGLERIKKRRS
ncbi:MAG: hypothetical protein AAB497_04055 [Patescibacteria group bacterium]